MSGFSANLLFLPGFKKFFLGFSDECDQGANTVRDTRLCGGKFAAVSNGKIDATVCGKEKANLSS